MAEIQTVSVKLSAEELARGGVYWERDHLHALANAEAWPEGEVWISDSKPHRVANTLAVQTAQRGGRLTAVDEKAVEVDEMEIKATPGARALAEEAGIQLVDVPPTGKDGTITKPDIEKAILRAKAD